MADSIFDDLQASLVEAVEIKQGKREASKVTRYELVDVKELRTELNVTQQELAITLNASVDTIKSWESRRRNPTGLAAKVLMLIKKQPGIYKELAEN